LGFTTELRAIRIPGQITGKYSEYYDPKLSGRRILTTSVNICLLPASFSSNLADEQRIIPLLLSIFSSEAL
jgi:hypothetical protein